MNNTIIELIKSGIVFTEPPPELMHNYDNVNIALFSLYRIFTQKVKLILINYKNAIQVNSRLDYKTFCKLLNLSGKCKLYPRISIAPINFFLSSINTPFEFFIKSAEKNSHRFRWE